MRQWESVAYTSVDMIKHITFTNSHARMGLLIVGGRVVGLASENPSFPEKMINYCIPSIRTPTFEIIIPISKHHLVEQLIGGH